MLDLLKTLWRPIEKGLKFIGKVQSTILLSVTYFAVLGVVAIPFKLINMLGPKSLKRTYWIPRTNQKETEITLGRQF